MNAETLIGVVFGTYTLQKLVGQGGMGVVFLAQQSRPRRQVAAKVLSWNMTPVFMEGHTFAASQDGASRILLESSAGTN